MALFHNGFDYLPTDAKSPLGMFANMLLKFVRNWAFILNGGLSFGNGVLADNMNGAWVSMNTGAGNVDVTLTHNIGRIPTGFLVVSESAASTIYLGSVPATKTQITLRGSVGGVTALLFILSP